ncbi:triose-phosphate isomerase [Wenzhouxiangella sp. XN79A]|uniref:triose-phosphate isomerase n=1 Tax=Wenzhouxiangella sp. XN79A TaxID=2724193 RepID=UPI00144ACD95|nr:triose-phosphate isomerase [Wenzhouxiangella sp. XN79A]NKI35740.1 triose-phosphate isomerase [Wenzhouxiangella sp. XN79A]
MHPDRRPLIAGNWKMNGSQAMTRELIAGILAGRPVGPEVAVMPPFPYLAAARETLVAAHGSAELALGAQDLSPRESGAHTGDVSAAMLRDFGAEFVLVGHSERREDHGETDAIVAAKFVAAIDGGLIPVLCVGESLVQRDAGQAEAVIGAQIDAVVREAGIAAFEQAVVAYEPVWAIGTGRTATPEQAQEIHAFIRTRLANESATIAGRIRILYGGSMKPGNASALLACEDIDGGLIGGASLDAASFLGIVEAAVA